MPWKAQTPMSLKQEFVRKAHEPESNMSELCQLYGISRKTGYKWLKRYRAAGQAGLVDQSRRPQSSPQQTSPEVEQLVVAAREQQPTWGGRKLKRWLEDRGHTGIPAPSTITAILHRYAMVPPAESAKHTAYQRFEMSTPNALWQMDFKGQIRLANGQACHPLTVLDDHSRFLVGLRACANQQHETVQAQLTDLFRTYGLPARMLMDNGPPWGDPGGARYTRLTVWLLHLGIAVSHGRPYHPQTQGKDERLHRTLKYDLLVRRTLLNLPDAQIQFDPWRDVYNLDRPHEALDLSTPITRYQPSPRSFPATLPPIEYPATYAVRKVDSNGKISFRNQPWLIGKAFRGQRVGLRPDDVLDGQWHVFFDHFEITSLDLHTKQC
ncbi:MAG: IS481 family transposase [Candidatus Cloacimonetes bacterium]|nr:IS481 family transposase [Candidatus Cloacimonadota bacterium]